MDAIHLASAMSLGAPGEIVLVSADRELLDAAGREGMGTVDPSSGVNPL
jgi:predicted nucleic acid-binding protein